MKRKTIFVSPETHKKLKVLSAIESVTFDDLIKLLLKLWNVKK